MIDMALAQSSGGAPPPLLFNIAPIALVFLVFYFLLIRPQQQKAKQHETMLANLKKNDEVITSGGLYGKVVAMNEQVLTLEIAPNVRVRVHRPEIKTVITPARGEERDRAKEKE